FFSSRRRHTRFSRDWSSDVCSSDLGRLRPAGWSGTDQWLGAVHGSDTHSVHDPGASGHFPAGLATGMDGDHHYLHAHFPAAAGALPDRSAVLRSAGGAEPADGIPVAAGCHVGLLSEGCLATPCDPEPDFPGHDALHGYPDPGDYHPVSVPRHRPLAAQSTVLIPTP